MIISLKLYLLELFYWLLNVPKYFIDSSKNIKVFFARINSNKLTTKFLYYCFLSFYFVVNTSVTVSIFINFYYELIVMKIQVNSITLNIICDMVKHEFRVESLKARPEIQMCEFKSTSYEFRSTSYKLKPWSHEFKFTNH